MKVNFGTNNDIRAKLNSSSSPINITTNQGATINTEFTQPTTYSVEVNNNDGRLQTQSPISLRNVLKEGAQATVDNLEDIGNVISIERVDGSTIVYNASTSRYEVKLADLDGGSF